MFDVYYKSEKENLTDAERNRLKKLAASTNERRLRVHPRSLQDWEQGRRRPKAAVRAYMAVIRSSPSPHFSQLLDPEVAQAGQPAASHSWRRFEPRQTVARIHKCRDDSVRNVD